MSLREEKEGILIMPISTMPHKEGHINKVNGFSLSQLEGKRSGEEGKLEVEGGTWRWSRVEKLPGLGIGFIFLTVLLFQVPSLQLHVTSWNAQTTTLKHHCGHCCMH